MAVAQGRCSARPSSTAARQRGPAGVVEAADGGEQRGEVVGRRARGRRRPGEATRPSVERAVEGRGQLAPDQRREDLGGPVPDGGVGEHVGGLVAASRGARSAMPAVLRAQDVVAEQPLERRRVADRAPLELGDEDGGAVAGAGGDARAPCGTAAASSRARRARTARTPRCSRSRPRPGCAPAMAASVVGVGGQAGQQHVGDRPAGGQPDQVEAEGGGTDQGVRHGVASKRTVRGSVRPC